MKALILAAGYGSRLLPHTRKLPKPLFTLAGKTLLAIAVEKLIKAGCDHIFINTHHLADQICRYIDQAQFPVQITILHEPEILGTGGAIASLSPFIKVEENFWVVNADVVSDICLEDVQKAHENSRALATLVLHDFPVHNKVLVDDRNHICHFHADSSHDRGQVLAFTGIQMLSSKILAYFPEQGTYSSIGIFEQLCSQKQIRACIIDQPYWRDTGTIDSYRQTAREWICAIAMGLNLSQIKQMKITSLYGDGSDKEWFRASHDNAPKISPVVIGDHGICVLPESEKKQLQAFVHIGQHLYHKKIPVPRILFQDPISGMVAQEDLGTCHLADVIARLSEQESDRNKILTLYQQVIDRAIEFSRKGIQGFDLQWTYQTSAYSRTMILEKECRYFMEAFVNGYCGMEIRFEDLEQEFGFIADQALAFPFPGLMHRDLQSKNIMIKDHKIFFIDFQGARKGPFQYDLASLLLDPYTNLSPQTRQTLLEYAVQQLGIKKEQDRKNFLHTYQYCALCRNLQFLGAFSFLSQVKGKKQFETYIPSGVHSLKNLISKLDNSSVQGLTALVNRL